jgi:hypothetical protein
MFKELFKIFREIPYDLRGNNGIISCKFAAIFYYIIFLIRSHNIPNYMEVLAAFMKYIFRHHSFSHPKLESLQYSFGFGYLPINPEEYDVITSILDLDIDSVRDPTILEMGISEVAQDGTKHISHYFVLAMHREGDEVLIDLISAWGGKLVYIHQYMKRITREELAALMDDILTLEDFDIDVKTLRTSSSRMGASLLSMPEIPEIQSRPMFKFFFDPAFGKKIRVVDKHDFSMNPSKRERYFNVNSEMASILAYVSYKSTKKHPRYNVSLIKFNRVTSSMDEVFSDFLENYPEHKPTRFLEPKLHEVSRSRVTRSKSTNRRSRRQKSK